MKKKEKAYAKVNLHLNVLNKRKDSYHNIFSLNASIDLFDILTLNRLNILDDPHKSISIEIIPGGGEYRDEIQLISLEDNLISKAIKTYLNKIGKSGEVSISIVKNIPLGAGLGGGSSDAAATLRLIDNYLNGVHEKELLEIGSMIGADVPYCIRGGFAVCEGIGNRIKRIEGKLDSRVLIANCGIHVDTGMAYKALDRNTITPFTETDKNQKLFEEGIKRGNISNLSHIMKNDFEKSVFKKYPEIRSIKEVIMDFNADFVTMTGTGSTIIGLFQDPEMAGKAKKSLSTKIKQALIAKFV